MAARIGAMPEPAAKRRAYSGRLTDESCLAWDSLLPDKGVLIDTSEELVLMHLLIRIPLLVLVLVLILVLVGSRPSSA